MKYSFRPEVLSILWPAVELLGLRFYRSLCGFSRSLYLRCCHCDESHVPHQLEKATSLSEEQKWISNLNFTMSVSPKTGG